MGCSRLLFGIEKSGLCSWRVIAWVLNLFTMRFTVTDCTSPQKRRHSLRRECRESLTTRRGQNFFVSDTLLENELRSGVCDASCQDIILPGTTARSRFGVGGI